MAALAGELKEGYKLPPEFPEVDGIRFPAYCTRELLDSITNLPVKEGDVFVATYPKAGTTWVSEILWQIYNGGKIDTTQILFRIPFVDMFEFLKVNSANVEGTKFKGTLTDFYSQHPPPRIFKTHLPYHLVPKGEGSAAKPKYIYVIRNPKDTAVSHYHHMRRFKPFKFNREWDEFFELWLKGKVVPGMWIDHVLGWWAHRDDPDILFLKYEDMKKDLEKAVRQIAEFVDKDLSEEMIKKITKQTSFDAMKNGEQFYQGKISNLFVEGETQFIRKGVVGDWRNYFTDEQSRRFDKLYEEKISGSGLELEF